MTYYVISYPQVVASLVNQDTYDEITYRHKDVELLKSGSRKACEQFMEEFIEETNEIDLEDYDTTD